MLGLPIAVHDRPILPSMIDSPSDPLAASLRLQLEGDIRLQAGDYELVYEDRWAVVRPVRKKSVPNMYLGPIFVGCILTAFWLVVLLIPVMAAQIVFGLILLSITALFMLAIIDVHRQFSNHSRLPPLLCASASEVQLPQTGLILAPDAVLALYVIRVPLKMERVNKPDSDFGTFDQAGLIRRDDEGGVSAVVLSSNDRCSLSGLWAALEELAKVHSIRFIEQEWPRSRAIDRVRIDRIVRSDRRFRFRRKAR